MMSRRDLVAFLRANGALDVSSRYTLNALGIFHTTTAALHPCDTTPLYTALGAPFGSAVTIYPTKVTVEYDIMLAPDLP